MFVQVTWPYKRQLDRLLSSPGVLKESWSNEAKQGRVSERLHEYEPVISIGSLLSFNLFNLILVNCCQKPGFKMDAKDWNINLSRRSLWCDDMIQKYVSDKTMTEYNYSLKVGEFARTLSTIC